MDDEGEADKNSETANNNEYDLSKAPSTERPCNDPVYGQRSAFPGLKDVVGDELFYGPAEDGIEYLRMVR
jgi:regulator of vacuolar morphogenesis